MSRNFTSLVQAPSVFVSKTNYPNISVGFLTTFKDKHHDDPNFWSKKDFKIPDVTQLRQQLTNSFTKMHVKERHDTQLHLAQELAMAKQAVDTEITFRKSYGQLLRPQQEAIPYGPSATLQSIQIQENIKTNKFLEKYYNDIDCSSTTALRELHKRGVDEHTMMRAFSVGTLGRGTLRKLVPTRWSITAVDDTLAEQLRPTLTNEDTLPNMALCGGYLGNYFLLLFFDGPFSFEFIEILTDSQKIMRDHESALGRKEYAQNTAGGYYATKLPIIEYFAKQKKQASVIAIRFITDEYYQGLGVWVVREACRKALAAKPIEFSDTELLKVFAKNYAKRKFGFHIEHLLTTSPVLTALKEQKNLQQFFSL